MARSRPAFRIRTSRAGASALTSTRVTSMPEAPTKGCGLDDPVCRPGTAGSIDVMGYHDARQIPNYWKYAQDFVLQDHMFEPNYGWSLPAHLFTVSGWSASCRVPADPMTCASDLGNPDLFADRANPTQPAYGWTDLTYLLYRAHISWR